MESVSPFQFKTPTTIMVCGSTGVGKTVLIFKVIKNRTQLFDKPPEEIIWCYGAYQEVFERYKPDITFHQGLIDVETLDRTKHKLIVIDDLMHALNRDIAQMFTVYSHHKNITVIFIMQNIFYKNQFMRDIALNTHYMILFNQKRDVSQILRLASQVYPGKTQHFIKVYNEAVSERCGYLMCDFHPKTSHRFLLYRNILPGEVQTAYIPTDEK